MIAAFVAFRSAGISVYDSRPVPAGHDVVHLWTLQGGGICYRTNVMQPPSPPSEEYRKELVTYRSWLHQVDFQASNEQDKLLTTLSAGALSVSVGFFRDASGLSVALQSTLLGSWMLFTFTLVVALVAFRPTRDMLKEEIERTDALITGQAPSNEKVVQAQQRAKRLNSLALCFFVGGMVLQLLFLGMRY